MKLVQAIVGVAVVVVVAWAVLAALDPVAANRLLEYLLGGR